MTDTTTLYQEYGEYNVLYNQLNMPSPSVEYAWRKTKKLIEDEVMRIIRVEDRPLHIADIGSGNGALLLRLAEYTRNNTHQIMFHGFDLSEPFVKFGRQAANYKKLSNVEFNQLDVETEQIPGNYDVILCSEVLEHVHNPQTMIKNISRHLHNGGHFILTTPNSKNLIKYPFYFLKQHISRKDSKELSKSLTEAEQKHKLAEMEQHLHVFSLVELIKLLGQAGLTAYCTPRSTTLFGGPFLDNHPTLLGSTMIFDRLADMLPLPQLGWDNIIFSRKNK